MQQSRTQDTAEVNKTCRFSNRTPQAEAQIRYYREEAAKVLAERGPAGLDRVKECYRMMLAWGLIGGIDMKAEITAAKELGTLEGWQTGNKVRDAYESDQKVAELRAKLRVS